MSLRWLMLTTLASDKQRIQRLFELSCGFSSAVSKYFQYIFPIQESKVHKISVFSIKFRGIVHSSHSSIHTSHFQMNADIVSKEFYRRPLPRHCIAFGSPEGKQLFQEALLAGYMESYFSLASQFCTQEEPSYCGLATLVMVLNALELDPGRVWKGPWRWYHESMLTCCLPSDISTNGIVLDKFVQLARCYGLARRNGTWFDPLNNCCIRTVHHDPTSNFNVTEEDGNATVDLYRVNPSDSLSDFRKLVAEMTSGVQPGYLVVSYSRSALGQTGTGHFAPVGAYHHQRELVLLFDTARFKYPPHWVPLARLWASMAHIDPATQLPRGYMVLRKASTPLSAEYLTKLKNDSSFTYAISPSQVPKDNNHLRLFGISDAARQAYLSPSCLLDENSVGFKLRKLADKWIEWLLCSNDKAEYDVNNVISEALEYFLKTIKDIKPVSFFFTIEPLIYNENDQQVKQNDHFAQYDLLRNLLGSSIGLIVSKSIPLLDVEFFKWLTTDGTFRFNISNPEVSYDSLNSQCPFIIISDPGIRYTLLMTIFLYAFPYNHLISLNPECQNSYAQFMVKLIEQDNRNLSDSTITELHMLENVLCLLFYQSDSNLLGQRCIDCLAKTE